jgi:hypothetical protein
MMPSACPSLKSRFYGLFRHFLPYIPLKMALCAKIPRTMREKYTPLASNLGSSIEFKQRQL